LAYGFVEDAQLTIVMVVLVLTAFEFTLFAVLLCGGFTDGIRSRYIDASWRSSALDVHDDPVTRAASASRRQASVQTFMSAVAGVSTLVPGGRQGFSLKPS
jgi:hypothetical protein